MIRTLIASLCLFVFATAGWADSLYVATRVTEATLYRDQAQVTARGAFALTVGEHAIVLRRFPGQIDARSLQVRGTGEFTILSARPEQEFGPEAAVSPEVKAMRDSVDELKADLDVLVFQRDVYKKEEEMLLENRRVYGANTGLVVAELQKAVEFFRQKMLEVKAKINQVDERVKRANKEYEAARQALEQMTQKGNQPGGVVVVTVRAAKVVPSATLTVSYLTSEAGWDPIYDARAAEGASQIELVLKAQVRQNTGQDWRDVRLAFSSGTPGLGAQKPDLTPLTVDFFTPMAYDATPRVYKAKAAMAPASAEMAAPNTAQMATLQDAGVAEVAVDDGGLQVLYTLEQPASVPAGATTTQTLELRRQQLPANLTLACAPALDKDVFVLATVRDFGSYALIPGQVNVFYDGVFTGEAYLPASTAQDSLQLSLGRDSKVSVSRQALPTKTTTGKIFNNQKRQAYAYQISVRNGHKTPIDLRVEDRVPISRNADIAVEREELSGGQVDEATGIVRWQVALQPNDTRKLDLRYTLKYPKDKQVRMY